MREMRAIAFVTKLVDDGKIAVGDTPRTPPTRALTR